jgi:hypothetical protein
VPLDVLGKAVPSTRHNLIVRTTFATSELRLPLTHGCDKRGFVFDFDQIRTGGGMNPSTDHVLDAGKTARRNHSLRSEGNVFRQSGKVERLGHNKILNKTNALSHIFSRKSTTGPYAPRSEGGQ